MKKKDEEEKISNELNNQINEQWEKLFETKGPFKLFKVIKRNNLDFSDINKTHILNF